MQFHFSRAGPVEVLIDRLTDPVGGIRHPDIVREMVVGSLKAGQEAAC